MERSPSMTQLNDALKKTILREDDGVERLIIGLDFGTTYSGIAYAFSTKPESVYTINEWPGAKGRIVPKCPTLVKYESKDTFKWGYEVDRTTKGRIEGIKLLLDPDQPKPIYVPAIDTNAELQKLGKPAVDVAADYIRAIFQHSMRKIEAKYTKSYLELLEKRYVLSVPAIWSDKAKNLTLRAAENAGITPITLIKEPEAAAMFTLHDQGPRGLDVGDALVLCDAGGGTVDLISYEITKLQPFELKELTLATGTMAGSLMVNKRFEEWVQSIVGSRAYVELQEKNGYRVAMKQFDESVKLNFRSRDDEIQYVNFPMAGLKDEPERNLKSDTIAVSGHDLQSIYDPIFQAIDKLIAEQVMQVRLKRMKENHEKGFDIKAIFLVGGFGSNAYVYEATTNAHPDIQVIQPNDAWAAIVRGAVLSKLPTEAIVTTSVAPKHYGVAANSIFDPLRDAGRPKYFDEYESVWRCETMTWYITKGDDLQRSRKIDFPFFRTFDPDPPHSILQVEEQLLECTLEKAPKHQKAGMVMRNCLLKCDLSVVPKDAFRKKSLTKDNGHELNYWELHYRLLVTIDGARMRFSMVCGGKEYGQVEAEY